MSTGMLLVRPVVFSRRSNMCPACLWFPTLAPAASIAGDASALARPPSHLQLQRHRTGPSFVTDHDCTILSKSSPRKCSKWEMEFGRHNTFRVSVGGAQDHRRAIRENYLACCFMEPKGDAAIRCSAVTIKVSSNELSAKRTNAFILE